MSRKTVYTLGEFVTVRCPGHRKDGATGTISYIGLIGTIGVDFGGPDGEYGFLPHELDADGGN